MNIVMNAQLHLSVVVLLLLLTSVMLSIVFFDLAKRATGDCENNLPTGQVGFCIGCILAAVVLVVTT